ncbi:MAG: hypothetical protein ABIN44_03300 [Burkholderiaceae bacterium]
MDGTSADCGMTVCAATAGNDKAAPTPPKHAIAQPKANFDELGENQDPGFMMLDSLKERLRRQINAHAQGWQTGRKEPRLFSPDRILTIPHSDGLP